jgi:flagellar basal-body rod modification protein FlgD
MSIQATSSSTDPTAAATGSTPSSTSADATAALGNENTFLQLMVAQLKNQDPTQPMDSTAFLSQLAQFSQLEQLIGIHQSVNNLAAPAAATDPTSQTGTSQTPAVQ